MWIHFKKRRSYPVLGEPGPGGIGLPRGFGFADTGGKRARPTEVPRQRWGLGAPVLRVGLFGKKQKKSANETHMYIYFRLRGHAVGKQNNDREARCETSRQIRKTRRFKITGLSISFLAETHTNVRNKTRSVVCTRESTHFYEICTCTRARCTVKCGFSSS